MNSPGSECQSVDQTSRPHRQEVKALILKGGGVKGLAFIGALLELEAEYSFEIFVGTSAGAITASMLAAGMTAEDLERDMRETDFSTFARSSPMRQAWNLLAYGGLHKGDQLQDWINEVLRQRFPDRGRYPQIEMRHLADVGRRAILVASHARLGTLIFDSNNANERIEVAHAARLSSSIPLFFTPETYNGHRVYDGGLLHNFPVEIYEKIRVEEAAQITESFDTSKDFLALYLGKPASAKSKWPLREALSIMLSRDETVVIEEHANRSIILDTEPVRTEDFDLSNVEKDYLLQVGRTAALEFLADETSLPEAKRERDRLRAAVVNTRRLRKGLRWTKRAALLAALLFVAGWSLDFIWPETFSLSRTRHKDTFVDDNAIITGLGPDAVSEIRGIFEKYKNLRVDAFLHEEMFQVVLMAPEDSIKIVVYEGAPYDSSQQQKLLKATASDDSLETPTSAVQVFVREDKSGRWESGHCPDFRRVRTGGKIKYDERQQQVSCVPSGRSFRMVQIAYYPTPFKELVEPWILTGHRLVGSERGEATYVLLGDAQNGLRFLSEMFAYGHEGSDYYTPISAPEGASDLAWSRVRDLLPFLGSETVHSAFDAPFEGRLERVTGRLNDLFSDGATDTAGNRAFVFERGLVKDFDPTDVTLISFVKNRKLSATATAEESSPEETLEGSAPNRVPAKESG